MEGRSLRDPFNSSTPTTTPSRPRPSTSGNVHHIPLTPRLAAKFGMSEKEGRDVMKTVDTFSAMMRLLKLVKERRDELPEEDEDFGPAILRLIGEEIEKPLKTLSYSGLTQRHYNLLVSMGVIAISGVVCIEKEYLPRVEQKSFEETLEVILDNVARTSEAGCRILIAHFLMYANAMAKNLLGTKNINSAIFSELPLDHPNCPALGPISGKSDFVTANVSGNLSVRQFGTMIGSMRPKILIVEAKREATLPELSSQSQLFAQLVTLDYEEHQAFEVRQTRPGILTDGTTWTVFVYVPHGTEGGDIYMSEKRIVQDLNDAKIVLAILTVLCAGFKPKFERTATTTDEDHHSVQLNLPMYLVRTAAKEPEPAPEWPEIDIFGGNVIHGGED